MKRFYVGALGAIAFIATMPFVSGMPVLAQLQEAGENLVQNIQRQQVELNLSAQKKLVELDETGKEKVTWQALQDQAVVQPGDVLRYTVNSENTSERPAENLVITQPIPQRTIYILQSANSNNGATITYSIDNANTFVENPTIQVTLPDGTMETRPAPAEAYTHIRWDFSKPLDPATAASASYEVTVR